MSTNKHVDKEDAVLIHTVKYYLVIKKNKSLPSAAPWMDLEGMC